MTRKFYEQQNIGQAKYVVNFTGFVPQTHPDGSEFYNIRIFKNKDKKNIFVKELKSQGYQLA